METAQQTCEELLDTAAVVHSSRDQRVCVLQMHKETVTISKPISKSVALLLAGCPF